MLDMLKQLFEGDRQPSTPSAEAIPVAVATLLGEAALSDGTLVQEEERALARLVAQRFDLPEAEAKAIAAKGLANARASTDLWRTARLVNDSMSEAEKIDLIGDLWRIVLADGVVDDFEAALIRKLAGLLYIRDQDAGRARKQARRSCD